MQFQTVAVTWQMQTKSDSAFYQFTLMLDDYFYEVFLVENFWLQ